MVFIPADSHKNYKPPVFSDSSQKLVFEIKKKNQIFLNYLIYCEFLVK
jgi:hypothetical protein